MKYKVGDKVVLRISEDWCDDVVKDINKLPNGVATVKEVDEEENEYYMEEIDWGWGANDIEGLASEPEPEPGLETRFEIMDFEL